MQALACNTAIVSTDCVGGSAEILEDGVWGQLVPTGDAEGMAKAVLSTLRDEPTTDLTQRAHDFALDKIVAEYLQVVVPDNPSNETGRHR